MATLELLGVPIAVEADDPATAARLEALLSGFPRTPRRPRSVLHLASDGDGAPVSLYDGDQLVRARMDGAGAIAMLLWYVNQVALRNELHVIVHAGSVAYGGCGVVLPAPMESGKSTLVTALVAEGFSYLSDEFAVLSLTDDVVHPYPCPITLEPGSFDLFPHLEPRLPALLADPFRWHLRAEDVRPGSHCSRVPARLLVFPRYEAGQACRLEPMAHRAALWLLASETLNLNVVRGRAFETLGRLVRGLHAYRLVFADLGEACAAVASLAITEERHES